MKTVRIIRLAAFIVGVGVALLVAGAQQPEISRTDRTTAPTAASTLGGEKVTAVADVPKQLTIPDRSEKTGTK